MKNLFYTCAAMLGALALTACSNEAEEATAVENQQFTITASMGADTRTYVATEGNASNEYDVLWSEGDEIYIWGPDGSVFDPDDLQKVYSTFPLKSGSGTTIGKFNGVLLGSGTKDDLMYALYPVPDRSLASSGRWYYKLPDKYTYAENLNTNSPMYAVFGETDKTTLDFQHLCAMVRLKISGLAANPSNEVTVTLTSTNENYSGKAQISFNDTDTEFKLAAPTDANGGSKSISYTIPANTITSKETVLILDFPIPEQLLACDVKIEQVGVEPIEQTLATKTTKVLLQGEMQIFEIKIDDTFEITGYTTTVPA